MDDCDTVVLVLLNTESRQRKAAINPSINVCSRGHSVAKKVFINKLKKDKKTNKGNSSDFDYPSS